jgi:hypothetical protein
VSFGTEGSYALLGLGTDRLAAQALALGAGAGEAGMDALPDDLPLELGEHTAHAEHGAPDWRLAVEPLLKQKQADARGAHVLSELGAASSHLAAIGTASCPYAMV